VAAIRRLTAKRTDANAEDEPRMPEASAAPVVGQDPPASLVNREAQPFEHVFLGTSFRERDRGLKSNVEALLVSHEIVPITGSELAGDVLTDAIRQRIAQTDGMIALLTRREELEAGSWTTHTWVGDELAVAQSFGKPTVALVEEGVQTSRFSSETQFIAYPPGDSPRALLNLSQVIGVWKRRAGRILKVSIEPHQEIKSLFAPGPAKCRYRVALEGEFGDWRTAVLIRELGGAFLYLVVPRRAGFFVEVEVSDGRATWRSPAFAESVTVRLSRVESRG
jgi:hypothetical protein